MNENIYPERQKEQPSGSPADISVDVLSGALDELLHSAPPATPGASASSEASGECPGPGEWLSIAIGQANPDEANALMAHAALCGPCAARLRRSLRILSEEPSQEEAQEAARLASNSREWQHQMAVELAGTPHRSRRGKVLAWPVWAGAALAASLTLAAGLTFWWQRANTPERLLAEAYSHSRTFDLRMPGADYAQVAPEKHLRGGAATHESSRLLDARARIERRLENSPTDAHWLQLEARADLLDEKYDTAIDILDRLLAAGPVTSSLLADDASAYFQRGMATSSESDRATALDYLRRADELTPSDPVVLFNEAIALEDRGQVMNAVETWNRYLRFERDARWQAEGRRRLEALEQKLNRLKSHQSRMERNLATPQAMRALAADPNALGAIDEELSSTLLPELLGPAFPLPPDRSRGAPCDDKCQAARDLLRSLAASLEKNHRDAWLTQFLPNPPSLPSPSFSRAAQILAKAINANAAGAYLPARKLAADARDAFHAQGNAAGQDRAAVELAFAHGRSSDHPGCFAAIHPLVGRNTQFAWIQTFAVMQDNLCDSSPGTAGEDNPAFLRAIGLARDHGYTLLELRARNLLGAPAIDSGDAETSWKIYLPSVNKFYSGDYPPMRLYTTLSGLAWMESSTPRAQNALLLQREALGVLEMTSAKQLIPTERFRLASVAIRAGAVSEAQNAMRVAQQELAAIGGGESVKGYIAEDEMAMANFYLAHHDLKSAAQMLESARGHITTVGNTFHTREYSVARAELDLALGHPEDAEPMLRDALLEEEHITAAGGAQNITFAQQNRDLYAALAGLWLAQGRPGEDILALWERYRLRILGKPLAPCPNKGLACLRPALSAALQRPGGGSVEGQVILLDRALLYRADAHGVTWSSVPFGKEDILTASSSLERAVSSPATSRESVDQAALRVGSMLFGPATDKASSGQLLLEPDPLLGNLPWPAIETAEGPIGLRFDLAEIPSLLLKPSAGRPSAQHIAPLIVGASLAAGEPKPLPEVPDEVHAVARFDRNAKVLMAGQATEEQVMSGLALASAFHFAGHASEAPGGAKLLLAQSPASKPYLDSDLLRRHPPRFVQLAVFSACSSGKKEEGWNHGMGDIVDTLAALGVPSVVATRWQIDSASAVVLMDSFYGGLARGMAVPQALTAARRSLAQDARYRHPYYWAAYYASGAGKPNLRGMFQTAQVRPVQQ